MEKPAPPVFSLLDEKLLHHICKALEAYKAFNKSITPEDHRLISDFLRSYLWFVSNPYKQPFNP